MEIVELALSNFKRFASERLSFQPGLNLVWGPNESGKSTIHEAICCALFGRERNRPVESWDGGPSAVELTYRSNGRVYRIERKLTEGSSRLGVVSGDDLTDVVTAKDEIARTIADHLGISSRSVFHNTVSVRQTSLSGPGASDMEAVGSEIQRVLTGTAHVSADEVKKRLEAGRDAIKGRARPTNPREYDRIADRLTKLADELADARDSRRQIQNLEDEQAELDARITRDTERMRTLGALLDRHKRWSELKAKEAELDALHERCFDTLRDIRRTIEDLALVQKELADYADLVGKDEEIAEHLTKIESRREELESRLIELESAEEATGTAPAAAWKSFLAVAGALGLLSIPAWFLLDHWIAYAGTFAAVLIATLALVVRYSQLRQSDGSGLKHIADMANSARTELEQISVEEKSLLTYTKCPDVGRAWAKIKNYRNLVSRSREFEATLKGLLAGRKPGDWEAQEADLARDLSGIRRELEEDFKDYSPSTEESESWRSEHAALQNSLPLARERLHGVRGSLETERRNARDLAALEGELEFLHRRRAELDFVYKAYEEAVSAIDTVTETVSQEYLPDLSEQASAYLERLTSGRYTYVCIKPGWEITADCSEKTGVRAASLSMGTLDQLYFALRLGCGELLSAGRKLPVILDDPFPAFDRRRLDNALNLLKAVARENQVLLFTHDPYILGWAKSGDVSCMVHELGNGQMA